MESGFLSTEEQTVARAAAGNAREFRKLVERYHRPVFCFACNLLADSHEAEDITQEVFLAAFDHLSSFNPKRASLQTWLFTIARNRCVNHLKRKRPIVDGEVVANLRAAAKSDEPMRSEFWCRLDDALDALPIEQKTAFVLAEILDLSYAEISHIEQTTLGTIKSRIHRAKQRLRAVMAPTLGDE